LGWRPYQPANPGKVVCESRCGRKTATKRKQRHALNKQIQDVQPSPIPETLIAAYRATDYISRVNDVDEVLKIGEPAVWLARLFDAHRVSTAFFITADNPFSKVRSTAENAQAQERLREDLLDQTDLIFEGWGVGADRDWPPEKSFLALGLSLETARSLGARVSLFMDADAASMAAARDVGAARVELYTEPLAAAWHLPAQRANQLERLREAAQAARAVGLGVNAGHDLNLQNLTGFLQHVTGVLEVSIGHALISDALEMGYEQTVKAYLGAIADAGLPPA
jgi:hypothetical protein